MRLRTEFEKALDSLRARAFVAYIFPLFFGLPLISTIYVYSFFHLLTSKRQKPLNKMPTLGQSQSQSHITNA